MLFKKSKSAASAAALELPEIHPDRCDDKSAVDREIARRALEKIRTNQNKIRTLKAERIALGNFPVSRKDAEEIADLHFVSQGKVWMRSVAILTGQSISATADYYRKRKPELIASEERRNSGSETCKCNGNDIARIIAIELGLDPDLSV